MVTKKASATQKTEDRSSEGVTLDQALKEEGEGRTPEKLDKGPTKMAIATKIMEDHWEQLQSGKVKRKDIIKKFIEDAGLTPKGSATYFGSIKKKLEVPAEK